MPKVHSLLVVLALGTALLVRPAPAHACSCSRPGVEVSPGAGLAAPTNTVVRVSWWVGEVTIDETTLVIAPASKDGKERKSKKDKAREKDKGQAAATIEVEQTAITAGKQRTVTLRPKAPLAPETRYEVRAAAAAGEKPGVVGEFTTAQAADDTPPEWAGIGKASYVHTPAICCNCSTDDPYAQLDLVDADKTSDDLTPPVSLVYGVWIDDGKPFDAGALPAVIARPWSGKLFLGRKSECAPANFDLPTKAATVKLRVAPIDLAGHVGKPVNVAIEVPKPKEPAKPPAGAAKPAPVKKAP